MSDKNLKNKVFSNLIWRFMERILAQVITTVVTIVLARILMPDDYGAIAIITVFINICNIFVSKGFGNALIQKKEVDDTDYSTVFYLNLAVTLVLYGALFIAAPFIADFYAMPILSPLLRVMGLRIPCSAINSIQNAVVSRKFQFKRYFFATLTGTVISAVIGIVMALKGFGPWALCGQYLSSTWINTLTLWFTVNWRPKLLFSMARAKGLFSYGWKLLCSSLLDELNIELKSFFIGKVYSSADLAHYNRGKQFPTLLNTNINSSVSSVLFPAMVEGQDNPATMRGFLKRANKIATYVMFPLQIGLALVAEPLTAFLLTDKWLPSVPYMQIMCICFCMTPIMTTNTQVLKAMGHSGKYLMCTLASNIAGIVIMLCVLPFGVLYVALGGILSTLILVLMLSFFNKKTIDYGILRQLKDLLPNLILVAIMAAVTFAVGKLLRLAPLWEMVIQILCGIVVYVLASILTKNDSFTYTKKLIVSFLNGKKGK